MASCIRTAFTFGMYIKPPDRVGGNTGIEAFVFTKKYIDVPHWGYYIAKRYQPHTIESIYEKIGT